MADPITSFRGPHRFLSNFHPCLVMWHGLTFPSVEHAYQAAKTLQPAEQARIAIAPTPGDAKRLGRHVTLRPDWDNTGKLSVMARLLRQKFADPDLRALLLATGDAELVEGNNWGDRFWGVCDGGGHNHLGKLLMEVRAGIRGDAMEATG